MMKSSKLDLPGMFENSECSCPYGCALVGQTLHLINLEEVVVVEVPILPFPMLLDGNTEKYDSGIVLPQGERLFGAFASASFL
jgi:hypothetical protein